VKVILHEKARSFVMQLILDAWRAERQEEYDRGPFTPNTESLLVERLNKLAALTGDDPAELRNQIDAMYQAQL
jgi:hypothetical protein